MPIEETSALTQELEEASKVQMGMLPQAAPNISGYDIAAHIAPALSVGGDFYDFITLPGDRLGVVFGDAVGHGIAAALLMSMTLANFRFIAPIELEPQNVIEHINHHLFISKGVAFSSSVTAVYAILDWRSGKIACAAGGLQPYIHRSGNCEPIPIQGTRYPLGITEETQYESTHLEIAHGESLVLVSDGVPEAVDGEGKLYGFERLEGVIASCGDLGAREMIEAVLKDIQKFVGDESQRDDITLVVVKRIATETALKPSDSQRPILANELMIKSLFQYVMSPRVINKLVQNPSTLQLEGVEREATVLFSDIRAATDLLPQLSARDFISHLNEYFDSMVQIVLDNDGTFDKFVGDEIMAFWGAPVYFPDHAYLACKAALAMQDALAELNELWKRRNLPTFSIGIGINTGQMVFGHMGTRNKMMYTPFGEAVNLGARLEGTNKIYGTTILIGEDTYNVVRESVICREVDIIRVRGRESPVGAYELVGLCDG